MSDPCWQSCWPMHSTARKTKAMATSAAQQDIRKKRVRLLVTLLAKRLSPSERAEVLREWEMLCVLNGYDGAKRDEAAPDGLSLIHIYA